MKDEISVTVIATGCGGNNDNSGAFPTSAPTAASTTPATTPVAAPDPLAEPTPVAPKVEVDSTDDDDSFYDIMSIFNSKK